MLYQRGESSNVWREANKAYGGRPAAWREKVRQWNTIIPTWREQQRMEGGQQSMEYSKAFMEQRLWPPRSSATQIITQTAEPDYHAEGKPWFLKNGRRELQWQLEVKNSVGSNTMSEQPVTQNQFIHHVGIYYIYEKETSFPGDYSYSYYLFTWVTLIHPIVMIRCQQKILKYFTVWVFESSF